MSRELSAVGLLLLGLACQPSEADDMNGMYYIKPVCGSTSLALGYSVVYVYIHLETAHTHM